MMDLLLNEHVVLVTGSSRGIGNAIAEAFLNEGATVILSGRDESTLAASAQRAADRFGNARVFSITADFQHPEEIAAAEKKIATRFQRLDHLVCNIGSGKSQPPLEEDAKEVERMIGVNLSTVVSSVGAFLPLLSKSVQHGLASTSITLIGSICGLAALGCPVGYAAAKAAAASYVKNIARPLGSQGIRANMISPGNILFPGSTWEDKCNKDPEAVNRMLEREVPLKRLGRPEDIAHVCVFLASARSSFVTGANWVVDGGQLR